MEIYLQDIPLQKAITILEENLKLAGLWKVLGTEKIRLDEKALGRVISSPLYAKISSPGYNSSAMDGFVVNSRDTEGATFQSPKYLQVDSQARYVDTGDPIPAGFNAVIPIEEVEALDGKGLIAENPRRPDFVRLRSATVPWKHIRSMAEDIFVSQLIYVGGHVIRPVDLGVIAAAGYSDIEVATRPRVAILPTGTELIPIGTSPGPGEILEFNSLIMAGKILEWGGEPTRFNIIKDDFEEIFNAVVSAAEEFDLILLNAGSSAGSEDFSADVIEKSGQLLVHGVAARPGHPVIIGMVNADGRKVPIMGIPGYPVSASLTMDIFVKNLLAKWLGRSKFDEEKVVAKLTRKITSPSGDDDYVRITLARVGQEILATPLSRGAGVVSSLSQADGLLIIPSGIQGKEVGEKVEITLIKHRSEIENTILCIGSHDLLLDKLAESISRKNRRLISINIGSMGGLIALNRQECHLAGSHLLDVETGEYNFSFIKKYVNSNPVSVIALAMREQGLLVKKGNPKRIFSLKDLKRSDVNFINRQKGAGTRVLLDYSLKADNIQSDKILGYEQEEYTHIGVASAVASGRADCGLAISAASIPYDLDFIPLFYERYDLIVDQKILESELLKPLLETLNNANFKSSLSDLKGYDFKIMGQSMVESK